MPTHARQSAHTRALFTDRLPLPGHAMRELVGTRCPSLSIRGQPWRVRRSHSVLIFPEHAFTRACSRAPHNLRVGGGVCHCHTTLTVHVSRPLPTHPLLPPRPTLSPAGQEGAIEQDDSSHDQARGGARGAEVSGMQWSMHGGLSMPSPSGPFNRSRTHALQSSAAATQRPLSPTMGARARAHRW